MKILVLFLGIGFSLIFGVPVPDSFGEQIILEKTLEINIIQVGDEWTSSEIQTIKNNLPSIIEPSIILTGEKAGLRYNYEYQFFSVSGESSTGFFSFMKNNAVDHPVYGEGLFDFPIWQEWWIKTKHPEFVETDSDGEFLQYKVPYKLNNAEEVEKYLYDKFIANNSDLNKPNSVNLVFLKGDLDDLDYLHNYYLAQRDKATNKPHNIVGMMGYGGNYNLYFFDLYAVPWVNLDLAQSKWIIPDYMTSLHDCTSNTCFTNLVSFHVSSALSQIITPDYTYPVEYKNNYVLDTVIYSKPGSSIGLTPQDAERIFNKAKIKSELESLFPYASWDIKLSVEKRQTRGLSYEFKKQLESTQHFVIPNFYGEEKSIHLLNSDEIQPYLRLWAFQRTNSENMDQITGSASSWVIPVLIVVDSSDAEVYLDGYGVTGFAPPHLKNADQPCCALGVTDEKDLWDDGVGVSDLVLHEVGHVLGLTHPFQKWNALGTGGNLYFNWYASPMTYSGAPNGCGLLYDLVYSDTCGIASASYTEFERQHVSDAVSLSLIKTAVSNLEYYKNEDSGEGSKVMVENITMNLKKAIEQYELGNNLSSDGTIKYALLAIDGALAEVEGDEQESQTFQEAENDAPGLVTTENNYSIPIIFELKVLQRGLILEIKVTYPDGTEGNSGISPRSQRVNYQYSLEPNSPSGTYKIEVKYGDEIVHRFEYEFVTKDIPKTPLEPSKEIISEPKKEEIPVYDDVLEKSSDEKIPLWIKNNAEWWVDGQIDDQTFVNGIQFLIQENIIDVDLSVIETDGSNQVVPAWIKNTAEWWANNQISENEFIKAIEFLVKNGIISVEQSNQISTTQSSSEEYSQYITEEEIVSKMLDVSIISAYSSIENRVEKTEDGDTKVTYSIIGHNGENLGKVVLNKDGLEIVSIAISSPYQSDPDSINDAVFVLSSVLKTLVPPEEWLDSSQTTFDIWLTSLIEEGLENNNILLEDKRIIYSNQKEDSSENGTLVIGIIF